MDNHPGRLRPDRGGVAHRLIDPSGMYLNPVAWQRAHDGREIVGACRQPGCEGKLHTSPTHQAGRITYYAAACDTCPGEIASPGARILARSALHHEMPDGWWDRRANHLQQLRRLSEGAG